MDEITYRQDVKITAEQLSTVFRASGLRRPVDDLPRMQAMLDHADIVLTAWAGERLVGVARAITDYCYCCYLSDLAVDGEFQRRGIGKALIERLDQMLGEDVLLLLLAAPEAMDYYPHIGFQPVGNAWHKPRGRYRVAREAAGPAA